MVYIECDIFHFHYMYPNGIYGKIFWPIDWSIDCYSLWLVSIYCNFFSVWLDRSNVTYVTIRMNNKLQLQLQLLYFFWVFLLNNFSNFGVVIYHNKLIVQFWQKMFIKCVAYRNYTCSRTERSFRSVHGNSNLLVYYGTWRRVDW